MIEVQGFLGQDFLDLSVAMCERLLLLEWLIDLHAAVVPLQRHRDHCRIGEATSGPGPRLKCQLSAVRQAVDPALSAETPSPTGDPSRVHLAEPIEIDHPNSSPASKI